MVDSNFNKFMIFTFIVGILSTLSLGVTHPVYMVLIPIDLLMIVLELKIIKTKKDFSRDLSSNNLHDLKNAQSALSRINFLEYVVLRGFIVRGITVISVGLIADNMGAVVIGAISTVAFLWMTNNNDKDQKERLTRLLGEKSKALLDKLQVEPKTQPGMA